MEQWAFKEKGEEQVYLEDMKQAGQYGKNKWIKITGAGDGGKG